jgi:hypothetical protein
MPETGRVPLAEGLVAHARFSVSRRAERFTTLAVSATANDRPRTRGGGFGLHRPIVVGLRAELPDYHAHGAALVVKPDVERLGALVQPLVTAAA